MRTAPPSSCAIWPCSPAQGGCRLLVLDRRRSCRATRRCGRPSRRPIAWPMESSGPAFRASDPVAERNDRGRKSTKPQIDPAVRRELAAEWLSRRRDRRHRLPEAIAQRCIRAKRPADADGRTNSGESRPADLLVEPTVRARPSGRQAAPRSARWRFRPPKSTRSLPLLVSGGRRTGRQQLSRRTSHLRACEVDPQPDRTALRRAHAGAALRHATTAVDRRRRGASCVRAPLRDREVFDRLRLT